MQRIISWLPPEPGFRPTQVYPSTKILPTSRLMNAWVSIIKICVILNIFTATLQLTILPLDLGFGASASRLIDAQGLMQDTTSWRDGKGKWKPETMFFLSTRRMWMGIFVDVVFHHRVYMSCMGISRRGNVRASREVLVRVPVKRGPFLR